MQTGTPNVLFTSVGRRVELLRSFRQAYDELGLSGQIVALDIDPLAPALQVADRPYIVPRIDYEAYIPTLVEICRRENVALVFPLIDPDIPCLSANKRAIESTGAKAAVISPQAVDKTADKWQTMRFFQDVGLPTPRSWLPGDVELHRAGYPLFVKPRQGSASKHTFKVNNEQELAFFLDYIPNPIIQEYLPGPEITNDVICDLSGEVLGIAMRQRIEVRWGEVAKGITVYDPQIAAACTEVARALPAVGPITVQCIMKEGTPHFTEINARFGGGMPLGIAAGIDAPRWLLARAAGLPLDIPPAAEYQVGLVMTRCDDSFFLTTADQKAMEAHRI